MIKVHMFGQRKIKVIQVQDLKIPVMRYECGVMAGSFTVAFSYIIFPSGVHASYRKEREKIVTDEYGDMTCVCGNAGDGGFSPCLVNGTVVEPDISGPWKGRLYLCGDCGRVVDHDSLDVIARVTT